MRHARGVDRAFEHGGDGGVGVGAAEPELQRAGDFVAEEGWEPGLFVEFDEVEAAHGIFLVRYMLHQGLQVRVS